MILLLVPDTNKGKVAAQEGEPKFSIGAGPSLTRRTSTIKSFEVYIDSFSCIYR